MAACVSFGISYAEEEPGADKLAKFIEPGVIVLILVLNATVGVWMVRALAASPALPRPPAGAAITDAHLHSLRRRTTPRTRWRL